MVNPIETWGLVSIGDWFYEVDMLRVYVNKSFNITEQSHAPEDPVFWMQGSFQVHSCDVIYVCPYRFLVNWTGIEA